MKERIATTVAPFDLEWTSRKSLRIYSKFSVGTMLGNRIAVEVTLENSHASVLRLHLTTPVRFELLFVGFIMVMMTLATFFGNQGLSKWLLLLYPLPLLLMSGIYRMQEQNLADKFKHWLGAI